MTVHTMNPTLVTHQGEYYDWLGMADDWDKKIRIISCSCGWVTPLPLLSTPEETVGAWARHMKRQRHK